MMICLHAIEPYTAVDLYCYAWLPTGWPMHACMHGLYIVIASSVSIVVFNSKPAVASYIAI